MGGSTKSSSNRLNPVVHFSSNPKDSKMEYERSEMVLALGGTSVHDLDRFESTRPFSKVKRSLMAQLKHGNIFANFS